MKVKDKIKFIKYKYPTLKNIRIQYHGSGDSFQEFWDIDCEPDNNKIEENEIDDLLWFAIENSDADFNNDGSSGTIIIDLEKETLEIDNHYHVMESIPSGLLTFKDEEIKSE